jgi:hypothetical protein
LALVSRLLTGFHDYSSAGANDYFAASRRNNDVAHDSLAFGSLIAVVTLPSVSRW